MNITSQMIKELKIETKQDFIHALDIAIELANQLNQCIDDLGSALHAHHNQALKKAA